MSAIYIIDAFMFLLLMPLAWGVFNTVLRSTGWELTLKWVAIPVTAIYIANQMTDQLEFSLLGLFLIATASLAGRVFQKAATQEKF